MIRTKMKVYSTKCFTNKKLLHLFHSADHQLMIILFVKLDKVIQLTVFSSKMITFPVKTKVIGEDIVTI